MRNAELMLGLSFSLSITILRTPQNYYRYDKPLSHTNNYAFRIPNSELAKQLHTEKSVWKKIYVVYYNYQLNKLCCKNKTKKFKGITRKTSYI